jgi:hypothetical protein
MLSLYYHDYRQVRELYLEHIQMSDSSLVLQAPHIIRSQPDIINNLEKVFKLFINKVIRKRFDNYSFF